MSQNPTRDKKPYETPALTKVGKVEDITQGGTVHLAQDTVMVLGSQ